MLGHGREWRGWTTRAASLLLACCSGTSACTRLNPAYDESSQSGGGSSGTTLAGSDTAQSSTGSTGTTGTGTGSEGVTGTSGQPTNTAGPESGACGDAILDPGEECDDGNDADDDGCLSCVIPSDCAEILALAPASPSGIYHVDPKGSGEPWPVTCDMDKDGGGWTGFSVQDTCNGHLDSVVVPLVPAQSEGVDRECRPFSKYVDGGEYAYTWDITFPPSFSAFFLRGYEVKGLGDAELKFPQLLWEKAYEFPNGALSLGDAHDDGPLTNWASDGGMVESFLDGQILPYPVQETAFELGKTSDVLRIGWGETGIYTEGLYPWWSGQIFVR